MEEPQPERMADPDDRRDALGFDELVPSEELVAGDRTRDDFFDAVLGLTSPATAGEVADRAGHGVDAAREYLEWFERMGIVRRVSDAPAMYERNQAYLNWRRVQHLRTRYDDEELLGFLEDATERAESYAEAFDANAPDDVAIAAHSSATGRSVEDVWRDVSAWKTTRRRIALLERALRADSDDAAGQRSVA